MRVCVFAALALALAVALIGTGAAAHDVRESTAAVPAAAAAAPTAGLQRRRVRAASRAATTTRPHAPTPGAAKPGAPQAKGGANKSGVATGSAKTGNKKGGGKDDGKPRRVYSKKLMKQKCTTLQCITKTLLTGVQVVDPCGDEFGTATAGAGNAKGNGNAPGKAQGKSKDKSKAKAGGAGGGDEVEAVEYDAKSKAKEKKGYALTYKTAKDGKTKCALYTKQKCAKVDAKTKKCADAKDATDANACPPNAKDSKTGKCKGKAKGNAKGAANNAKAKAKSKAQPQAPKPSKQQPKQQKQQKQRRSGATSLVATGAVVRYDCQNNPPTWDDVEREFRTAQERDATIGRRHVVVDTTNDARPDVVVLKQKLNAFAAPRLTPVSRLQLAVIATQEVSSFSDAAVVVSPFTHAITGLATTAPHVGSARKVRRKQLIDAQILAVKFCVEQYVENQIAKFRAGSMVLTQYPVKPSGANIAHARAHMTEIRAAGLEHGIDKLRILEYTGAALASPRFRGGGLGLTVDLTQPSVDTPADNTWMYVPFDDSECWYARVPRTAKVWMTDSLTGCHVYVARNAATNDLLVMHTNGNRLGQGNANHKAKLDCMAHVMALNPTYTPYAQWVFSDYYALAGNPNGNVPFGINVGGTWRMYFAVWSAEPGQPADTRVARSVNWNPCPTDAHGRCVFTNGVVMPLNAHGVAAAGPSDAAQVRQWPIPDGAAYASITDP